MYISKNLCYYKIIQKNSRKKLQPHSENELLFKYTACIEQHFKEEMPYRFL